MFSSNQSNLYLYRIIFFLTQLEERSKTSWMSWCSHAVIQSWSVWEVETIETEELWRRLVTCLHLGYLFSSLVLATSFLFMLLTLVPKQREKRSDSYFFQFCLKVPFFFFLLYFQSTTLMHFIVTPSGRNIINFLFD